MNLRFCVSSQNCYVSFMMRLTLLIFLMFAGPAASGSPIAEVICAPKQQMKERLTLQYGETRRATGMRNPEEIMEVWADPAGDWTMVITYASGKSCIVAMGEHWHEEPRDPA